MFDIDFSDVVAKLIVLLLTSASFIGGCVKTYKFLRVKYKEAQQVTRNYTVTDAMLWKALGAFSASFFGIIAFCMFVFFYVQSMIMTDMVGRAENFKELSAKVERIDTTTIKKTSQ
jgi:outer membrane lipoprotein-sorting protein